MGIASFLVANIAEHYLSVEKGCPARCVALDQPVLANFAEFREHPLRLMKLHPSHEVFDVDRQVLRRILAFALPRFSPPTAGLAIHEAGLWCMGGADGELPEGLRVKRCNEIVDGLLDQRVTRTAFAGGGESQLIERSPYGLHVNLAYLDLDAQTPTEFHFGQFVMAMGIAEVSADREIVGLESPGRVRDVLHDLQMNYSYDHELEFAAIAMAHYLPPVSTWTNQYDEEFSFDGLMARLTQIRLGDGACDGVHVPIAVACLLAADRQYDILGVESEASGHEYLQRVSIFLNQHQSVLGGWSNWVSENPGGDLLGGGTSVQHLSVTGHHLEWVAISDPHDCPSRETILRAANSLLEDIDLIEARDDRTFKPQLPATHAARALLILSGNRNAVETVVSLNSLGK